MSPQQRAQIQARLAQVAAERAAVVDKLKPAATPEDWKAMFPPKPVTTASVTKPAGKTVTHKPPMSDTGNAARCKRARVKKGEAGKAADTARKKASRAKAARP